MSLQSVLKHDVLDVELLGDESAPWHIRCTKTQFSGPPGKFGSGASDDGSVESEDDSISTGCSEASLGSGRTSQTSSARGSWPDVAALFSTQDPAFVPYVPDEFAEEVVCAFPEPPPGLSLAHSSVLAPPGLSHVGPPPGLSNTDEVDSLLPSPPGHLLAPVFYPPGMFEWDVNQTRPTASGQSKRTVSRRGTVYHAQTAETETSSPESTPADKRTTVMLRNLPGNFSRDALTDVLDQEGFKSRYDFVYLPMNFKKGTLFGYALVNLLTPVDAWEAKEHFEGFSWPGASAKAEVVWYETQQGYEALVERFRSSPVMRDAVPDAVRPAVYHCGVRCIFPQPLKPIKTK